MMQKPLFCAGLMRSFICSLPIGFSVGFRHCFPPIFTFLFLHVQLFSQPRLPFFPLLLKPEMACGRINTEASRCFYHIVSSVCTIGRNNLIVISKRKPARNTHSLPPFSHRVSCHNRSSGANHRPCHTAKRHGHIMQHERLL